jgi:hypothetical protein
VIVKELPLCRREPAAAHGAVRVDTHPVERRPVRQRRNDEVAVALEPDEATVKQMVDAWGQQ